MMNHSAFRVTVVVPSYNMALTLPRAIQSAARQSLPPLEILVIDDGSTDSTVEVLKDLQSKIPLLRFITQKNGGNAAAKNTGVRNAQGDWIGFLDADDEWLPDRLIKQTELLEREPDCCWAAGAYQRIRIAHGKENVCGKIRVGNDVRHSSKDFFDALSMIAGPTSLWIGTVLAKKTTLQELGLFDETLSGCDDTDFWVRMALNHPQVAFVKQPIAKYTVAQAGSLTSLAASQVEPSRLTFFSKLKRYSEAAQGVETKSICRKILQKEVGTYVRALARSGNPGAAKRVIQWSQSNNMPGLPWKYTLAASLPAPVIRAARSVWHYVRGKLR